MIKSIIVLLIAAFLAAANISLAANQPAFDSEINLPDVTAEDLGLKDPQILPDSPIYFLKDLTRNIQSFFTFNPVKKLELRTKIANEKLLEAKKLVEKSKKPEIIKKALDKYQADLELVKNLAEKMKEETAASPETEKFLEKFEKQKELQQKILKKLEQKVPEQVLEKIKESREKHLENFEKVMEEIQKKKNEGKETVCGDGVCDASEMCIPSGRFTQDCGKNYCVPDCDIANPRLSCNTDTDCACGKDIKTGECAFGNEKYIDDSKEVQCPDFCSGVNGNLEIKCVRNRCEQVAQ